ncbi:hypothetical protein NHL50_12235 [Acidimicrobiia bacterium EGI L10123]|uniref:hypothetical protein n=1 Tax=Salinilacustrithrix flava TaxID=2957203 RepID=UPI003D7C242E|nr:hypothetical protein [Acidimicrobiia bacterium EGI L10123]
MVLGRRPASFALLVLAAFALVVTSGAPRGMLRAVAVSELDERPTPSSVVTMSESDGTDVRLPSVRVSIAREDEEASGDVQTEWATASGLFLVEDVEELDAPLADEPAPFLGHIPARAWGDRAPPTPSF